MKSLAAGDVALWFRDGMLTSRPRCLSNQFLDSHAFQLDML